MENLREQIEDVKSHIYMRDDGAGPYCDVMQSEFIKLLDGSIDRWCMSVANRLPTDEERAVLRSQAAKGLLLLSGISDERLKEIELIAEIAVEEKKLEALAGQASL